MDPVLSTSIISTTTTSFSRIRGFTIELLFLLQDKGLRTSEIGEITQKTNGYVCRYLLNMRKYGLLIKQDSLWILTPTGRHWLNYFHRVEYTINYSRKIAERKLKDTRKIAESYDPKKTKQVPIKIWLQDSSLDDIEKAVVEVLMEHYNETRGKFIFANSLYEVAERFIVNPTVLPQALRKLNEDHIVYAWPMKGWPKKIGLYKDFIAKLEASR